MQQFSVSSIDQLARIARTLQTTGTNHTGLYFVCQCRQPRPRVQLASSMSISIAHSHGLVGAGVVPPASTFHARSSTRISLQPKSGNAGIAKAGPRLIIARSESVHTKVDAPGNRTGSESVHCIEEAQAHKSQQQVVVKAPRTTTKPRVILISGPTA
jgi:hypothetical protein